MSPWRITAISLVVGAVIAILALMAFPSLAADRYCDDTIPSLEGVVANIDKATGGKATIDLFADPAGEVVVMTARFPGSSVAVVYTFIANCMIGRVAPIPRAFLDSAIGHEKERGRGI